MSVIFEPFRIKSVEPLRMTTLDERREILERGHWNLFRIRAEDILIDLLTDSGTGAMSSDQWGGIMRGDESYAGARSWYRFRDRIREITGFRRHRDARAEDVIVLEPPFAGGESDVWEIDRNVKAEYHPTQKPVDLVARAIRNSSQPEDLVGDFFAGGGSTIIAAEQLNRRCYAIEIEPRYCDIAVTRWEAYTNRKAKKQRKS